MTVWNGSPPPRSTFPVRRGLDRCRRGTQRLPRGHRPPRAPSRTRSASISATFAARPLPSSLTRSTRQRRWSPFAVDPRGGRMRTLSPRRIGRPGSSTLSGRCLSKFSPKARRDASALNSRSSSSPRAGSFALARAMRSVSRDNWSPAAVPASGEHPSCWGYSRSCRGECTRQAAATPLRRAPASSPRPPLPPSLQAANTVSPLAPI